MRVYQTSKVLLTQREDNKTQIEHNLTQIEHILQTVDKTRHICLFAAWLLSLCLCEQQGWCCLTSTVHQQHLTGSQPSSDLLESAGPSTESVQDNCYADECFLEFALRIEGIYMICGIFPSDFILAIHLISFNVYGR